MTPAARDWLQRYARHLATERRYSPHTCSAYARDLAHLSDWCEQQKLSDWTDLDAQHLRSFAARAHAGGLGARSIRRRLKPAYYFFFGAAKTVFLPSDFGRVLPNEPA